ncbi:MAG TPA: NAD(P)H-dependent oxidoreductase [Aquabacterium sp.]|nr:NAD(P)H-dependent oxidoreductase [Aquabacterium sp.]
MAHATASADTPRTLLVFAHPALERGRVNPAMAEGLRDIPGVTVHDLYEVYPDFTVDVRTEQKRLLKHDLIVLQFPLYWFSMPSLLKEWLDLVWTRGFAFGEGAKLKGRSMMCAVSTGANRDAYDPDGTYRFDIDAFLEPLNQTARYCGLKWLPPFVLHGREAMDPAGLEAGVDRYRRQVEKALAKTRPVARRA